MPYLRLHLPEVPIERKRVIAQRLIEITMHAFHLRPQERYQVSIEFISGPKSNPSNRFGPLSKRDADCIFEVMGHDLTEEKKRAFAEETVALLAGLLPSKPRMRIVRLLGVKPDVSGQIAFQFSELSPAVSEPFVVHPGTQAA